LTWSAISPARNLPAKVGVNAGGSTADGEYQQLMSDLFHDLSQPLSTLTCLLEVNLLLSRPAKRLRHDLKIALKQLHSIVRIVRDLRELADAGNVQQDQQLLPLAGCVRDVVADLLPVAESAKVKLSFISGSDCLVNFQASRLRQGVFHLLEFTLSSAATGTEITITASEDDEAVRLVVAVSGIAVSPVVRPAESAEWKHRDVKRRLGLAIARRIFEIADGSLRTERGAEQLWLEVRLPSALSPR
jgi:signal transduction histidine kinase